MRIIHTIVAVVLGLWTLGKVLAINIFVCNLEFSSFQNAFDLDAHRVLDGVGKSTKSNLVTLDTFASLMVIDDETTNQSFPFVTLPTFVSKSQNCYQ
jgi:hypothetical protein